MSLFKWIYSLKKHNALKKESAIEVVPFKRVPRSLWWRAGGSVCVRFNFMCGWAGHPMPPCPGKNDIKAPLLTVRALLCETRNRISVFQLRAGSRRGVRYIAGLYWAGTFRSLLTGLLPSQFRKYERWWPEADAGAERWVRGTLGGVGVNGEKFGKGDPRFGLARDFFLRICFLAWEGNGSYR